MSKSLDYYLNNLESRGIVEFNFIGRIKEGLGK